MDSSSDNPLRFGGVTIGDLRQTMTVRPSALSPDYKGIQITCPDCNVKVYLDTMTSTGCQCGYGPVEVHVTGGEE